MQFFKQVDALLSQNRVAAFPDSGLEFLERPPPEDPKLKIFHEQVVAFIKELIPTDLDVAVRQFIVDKLKTRIESALKDINNQWIFLPCGSCMSGTFLPTADIDFALYFYPMPCNPPQMMDTVKSELTDLAIEGFNPIPTASVPVLKFSIPPGINIDISFDELHGPLSVLPVRDIFNKNPCLLPAQLFFKTVLHRKGLDQPYKGGISSYTLQLMLLAYIQYAGQPENITDLIVGFCDFYGNIFNFTLTGIDVSNGGKFFSRKEKDKLSLGTPTAMCLLDPLNPKNILGHNAFHMNEIRDELKIIHQQIISGNGKDVIESLMGELIEISGIHAMVLQFADENDISA